MYDAGKIMTGLVVFLVILTLPFWYSGAMGKGGARPEVKLPEGEKKCVESKEYMRDSHMDLLNQWRDAVVREGKHTYVSEGGARHEMSLTNSCMKCHADRAQFCDRCHVYLSLNPFCWDCHLDRKQTGQGAK
ncbi:MAG: sulfate reduction electron transfer complex DsrMKJOP subunit DsrJ [Deltaproteobacteria bacterium]|nr:sulfate reduction electron transfer complex DsrMKJOP subunit DsrJ [Deltaproteobacteria bacterium]